MRVLISGGLGFLGAHLVEHFLKNTSAEVVVLDKMTYASSGFDRLRDIGAYDDPRVRVFGCDLGQPIPDGIDREVGDLTHVIHAAAETHVDNSIRDPLPFLISNVIGTHNLLWWLRGRKRLSRVFVVSTDEVYGPAAFGDDVAGFDEQAPFRPANPYSASKVGEEAVAMAYANTYELPVTIVNCWDMRTRVLSEHGPKNYDQIEVGELVWTVDDDESMVLTPVTDKIRMRGPSTMIHFRGHAEQLVTPNHRMMFRSSTGKPRRWGKIQEGLASALMDDLPSGRILFVRNGEWDGEGADRYVTSELINRDAERPSDKAGPKPGNQLPGTLSASWLARFFGWFISEGSTTASGQVRLAGMKPGQQLELRALLEEVGMDRVGSDEKNVYVSSQELTRLALLCGGTQDVRRVPHFVKRMAPCYLEEFIDAAFAGDGTWYVNAGRIYTMQEPLAYDYAEIGMKCGYSAMVSARTTRSFDGQKESLTYYTNLTRRSASTISPSNIREVPYDGDVWCVKVSTGRVFTTRAEGGVVLTGQTMNLLGERQHKEKYVPLVIGKLLRDEALYVHADEQLQSGTRFYLHCRTFANALHFLIDKSNSDQLPRKLHVCGEREISNLELAQLIAGIVGKELHYELVSWQEERPGHDLRYAMQDRLIQELGWKRPMNIEQSLDKTVRWYLANPKWLE